MPSHIWCFVDLTYVPAHAPIDYGGVRLRNSVYAVVEVASYDRDTEERQQANLFLPLLLDVAGIDADGEVSGRQFYLADTDAFAGPCCVIPNIGGRPNSYFLVRSRTEWAEEFVVWLEKPHNVDEMEFSDEDSEEEEVEG